MRGQVATLRVLLEAGCRAAVAVDGGRAVGVALLHGQHAAAELLIAEGAATGDGSAEQWTAFAQWQRGRVAQLVAEREAAEAAREAERAELRALFVAIAAEARRQAGSSRSTKRQRRAAAP
ncbi:hypothetical protein MNEG_7413 [Monoraphidium neglectum]|uniref:Uncharacterized protein n=1 Tax=Monoraphidium neglectum TaxID=145388 RepID=A0A0D2KZB7_9CHLO|nr:hypothetical protein MNEG_7413 [Monoraphidium neglectum]KIZ00549.1 hypothetical protein MNEG_7413 [Monoraphidium neglectum]|eukprot:XP_013899568.1 hypothetical protein MNEG_7413 [Monoraphidium neglectum]